MNKPREATPVRSCPNLSAVVPTGQENNSTTTANDNGKDLSSSLRSCSPAKASDWRLDYRDLLDADIECLEAIERHKRAIARLRREYAARAPRLEAFRGKA